ncbi:SDR family NAD(P)-dependent oxidoreductase [Mesorhizobium sp. ASY16-5R]|uniref:SDR family NAD(P)-dependent oxidoreductase n=1 Tax=Mesorhizobium sp. ASY16-5R TaxID=3445772 RepID=UPI003FA0D49B
MYEIRDKVAVITGGTRGIGLAVARQLLDAGGKVAINGRASTEESEALLRDHGPDRVAIEFGDVSVPDQATRLVDRAASRFGRLDILVHSAGGPVPGTVVALSPEAWMQAFAIHVHPVFHLFRAAHPHLAREGGAVLLVSSVAGLRGCPGTVAYQTVKGALIPMAKALAFDHAAEGIRVNVLAPGIIRTRFHDAMSETAKAHNLANRIPLRREGSVDDVAEAALALIRNEFITGEVQAIDGGMSMRITG